MVFDPRRPALAQLHGARRTGLIRTAAERLNTTGVVPACDRLRPATPGAAPFRSTDPLAKPNYSFEKRQREIAKKKAKDEKDAKKREAREATRPASATDRADPTDPGAETC